MASEEPLDELAKASVFSGIARRLGSPTGRNMGWLVGEQLFNIAVTGLMSVVVVRYLGPGNFGSYSFAVALVGIVGSIAQLTGPLVVRDIVVDRDREGEILASAALLTLSLVVIAEGTLVIVGFATVHDSTVRTVLFVLALALLVRPVMVLDFVFQADLRARQASLARNAGLLVGAAITLAIVVTGGSIVQIALATVAGSLIAAVLLVSFYVRGVRVPRWHPSRSTMSSLTRRSLPLVISSIAIGVYLRIDQVMLGWMSTDTEVGIYAATVRISEVAYFLPMVFIASVGPAVARAHSTSVEYFQAQMRRVFAYMSAASLTIAVIIEVTGGSIARILYGTDFSRVGRVLSVHILASVFVYLGVGESLWTVNESLEKLSMYRTIAGAIVNVLLNLALIPHYGAVGSAWATLIAYAVATTIGNCFHRDTRPVFWMQLHSLNPVTWVRALRVDLQRPTP